MPVRTRIGLSEGELIPCGLIVLHVDPTNAAVIKKFRVVAEHVVTAAVGMKKPVGKKMRTVSL